MRHRKKGHKLGRTAAHRKQTLAALSNALIKEKRITTTEAKAKALRPFVEPLITRAKDDTQHNRKQVFRSLQDKQAVTELFDEVSDRVGDRPGGYTRVIKLGPRSGDGAEMAMIELVDYNDVKPAGSSGGSSRTRRGSGKGRRGSGSSGSQQAADAEDTAAAEATDEAEATAETETAEAEATDADAKSAEEKLEEVEEALDEGEAEASDEAETDAADAAEDGEDTDEKK
jgi:large subunit ribosomal protein L17